MESVARGFAGAGFTANSLTFVGIVVGIAAACLFALRAEILAGFILLLCGFFDVLDGAVARITGRVTAFGGVLDSVADRYVDSLILIGIALGGLGEAGLLPGWAWVAAALVGSLMVSYTRARTEAAGSGTLDVGIAERGERLLILAFGAVLTLTRYAVVFVAILAHITVAQRLMVARGRLKG